MLKPAPLPTSPRIEDWERLRADMIAQEMQPTKQNPRGLTPAEATTQANARTRDAFVAMFPGRPLPINPAPTAMSVRAAPLPGGVKTADGRTWFPISRVEDGRSSIRPGERISVRELTEITKGYEPETMYRATVITPRGGPVHDTGEFATVEEGIQGHIDALDFDGHMMWGLAAQIDGGIDKAVAKGLQTRSTGTWVSRAESGGKPYLRHLALTAEPAGTWNLGPITKYYPGVTATNRTTSDGEMRFRTLADLPDFDQQRSRTMPNDEVQDIDYDAIATRTADILAERQRTATPAPEKPDFAAMVTRAVTAATAPLTAQITALDTQVKASADAAAKSALDARATRVRTAFDQGVRDGKVLPMEVESQVKLLMLPALTDEQVDEQLAAITKRSVIPLARQRPLINLTEDGTQTTTLPQEFAESDPRQAEIVVRARTAAAAETDPVKAYAIKRAAIYAAVGEDPNSN